MLDRGKAQERWLLVLLLLTFGVIGGSVALIVRHEAQTQRQLRDVSNALATILQDQLDEETGLHGYAIAGDRSSLELYDRAHRAFAGDAAAVRSTLAALPVDGADRATLIARADDLTALNGLWHARAARPALTTPGRSNASKRDAAQLRGQLVLDAFRRHVAQLDADVEHRLLAADLTVRALIATVAVVAALAGLVPATFVWCALRRVDSDRARRQREREFAAFAESLPQIVWTTEPDGNVDFFNRGWTEYTGLSRAESAGSAWHAVVHPEDLPRARTAWLRSVATGSTCELDVRLRRGADGAYRWHAGRAVPLRDEHGAIARWLGTAVDIDDQRRAAERREADLRALAEALPMIVWTATPSGAGTYFSQELWNYSGMTPEEAFGSGWVALIHPDDTARTVAAWNAALAGGTPYAVDYRIRGRDGAYRWFAARGQLLRDENGAAIRWLGTCADIHDSHTAAIAREREMRRMRFVTATAATLSEPVDLQTSLARLARVGLPEFGAWSQIDLRDDAGTMHTVALAHVEPAAHRALQALLGRAVDDRIGDGRRAIGTLETDADLAAFAPDLEAGEIYRRIGSRSYLSIPLTVGGEILGRLTFVAAQSRDYSSDDINIAQEIAERAALAIKRASVYEREVRVSHAFQDAALPKSLPVIAGISIDGFYQAARAEALVGGDWYDGFRLIDGRIVLSIGDVMGSGLEAAVTMNAVRQAIRGAAQIYPDPVAILDAAERVFISEQPDRIVTAFLGILDPLTLTFAYASAGHPPPFIRRADGTHHELMGHGLPLGLRQLAPAQTSQRLDLGDGALLVLYTDGATEATRDVRVGEERLHDAMDAVMQTADGNLAARIAALLPSSHDDVAVLTVLVDEARLRAGQASTYLSREFAATDAAAAFAARRMLAERLFAVGASSLDVRNAELIFTELLGNVVRHAGGMAHVMLDVGGEAPILHVLDDGAGFSFAARLPKDLMSESGRGLFIVAQLSRDLTITPRSTRGSHARAVLTISKFAQRELSLAH